MPILNALQGLSLIISLASLASRASLASLSILSTSPASPASQKSPHSQSRRAAWIASSRKASHEKICEREGGRWMGTVTA